MVEENEILKTALEKQPKEPTISQDFDAWLKMDKQRNSVETKSRLADLKDKIDFLSFEKQPAISQKSPEKPPRTVAKSEFGSFATIGDTRVPGDRTKTAVEGVFDTGKVFFKVAGNIIVDGGRLLLFPINETKYVIASQKKADPNLKII